MMRSITNLFIGISVGSCDKAKIAQKNEIPNYLSLFFTSLGMRMIKKRGRLPRKSAPLSFVAAGRYGLI